jgi:hypothetical protein
MALKLLNELNTTKHLSALVVSVTWRSDILTSGVLVICWCTNVGVPADLYQDTHVDWIPTVKMSSAAAASVYTSTTLSFPRYERRHPSAIRDGCPMVCFGQSEWFCCAVWVESIFTLSSWQKCPLKPYEYMKCNLECVK